MYSADNIRRARNLLKLEAPKKEVRVLLKEYSNCCYELTGLHHLIIDEAIEELFKTNIRGHEVIVKVREELDNLFVEGRKRYYIEANDEPLHGNY